MSSLATALKRGTAAFNASRKAGNIAVDQSGATLSQLYFARADVSGLDLSNAEFDECTVSDSDFRGCSLEGAFIHGGRFERCDFRGAKFAGASLENVEFAECQFDGAVGFDSVELTDVVGFGAGPVPVETQALDEEPKFISGKVAVNETLERELENNPTDASRWLVYADWLQSEGDLRGELITRHGKEGFTTFVREHLETLFPLVADELRGAGQIPELELEWRHGFVHGALIQSLNPERRIELPEIAHRLLQSPSCRFIHRLSFGLNPNVTQYGERQNDYAPVIDALIREPKLKQLTHLEFGIQEYEPLLHPLDDFEPYHGWGDLSALWKHVPHLRTLKVKGSDGELGAVHLPELRTAIFEVDQPEGEWLNELVAARWPKLVHFELWELDETQVEPLFVVLNELPLKRLVLPRAVDAARVLRVLADSQLLARLESVVLHNAMRLDAALALVEKRLSEFRHLKLLDLTTEGGGDVEHHHEKAPFIVLGSRPRNDLPIIDDVHAFSSNQDEDEGWDELDDSDVPFDDAEPPPPANSDLDIPDEHGD